MLQSPAAMGACHDWLADIMASTRRAISRVLFGSSALVSVSPQALKSLADLGKTTPLKIRT